MSTTSRLILLVETIQPDGTVATVQLDVSAMLTAAEAAAIEGLIK